MAHSTDLCNHWGRFERRSDTNSKNGKRFQEKQEKILENFAVAKKHVLISVSSKFYSRSVKLPCEKNEAKFVPRQDVNTPCTLCLTSELLPRMPSYTCLKAVLRVAFFERFLMQEKQRLATAPFVAFISIGSLVIDTELVV